MWLQFVLCGYCHRAVTHRWNTDGHTYTVTCQLWSCWEWREVQAGSECQDVWWEEGAIGRWDRRMLLSAHSPFPRREGGKEGGNLSPSGISAHWKLVGTHWTELQYYSIAFALALLIALELFWVCFVVFGFWMGFFLAMLFFPRHKVLLPFGQFGFSVPLLAASLGSQCPVLHVWPSELVI